MEGYEKVKRQKWGVGVGVLARQNNFFIFEMIIK